MPLLADEDRDYLRQAFGERMVDPVQIDLFTTPTSSLVVPGRPECEYCPETQELLEEVAGLTEKIQLSVHDITTESALVQEMGIERIPAIVVTGHNAGRVRYFGIPMGYEFSTLVEDLIDISAGHVALSEQSQQALAAVDQDLRIQVFVTPT